MTENRSHQYEPAVVTEMHRRIKGHCFTCGDPLVKGWESDIDEDMCLSCELAREWNINHIHMAYIVQAVRDRFEQMEAPRLPHIPPKKTYE